MACCNRNQHEYVQKEEERINEKGSEYTPLLVKIISAVVLTVALVLGFI
ncbi:hypothetical protein LC040_08235 [Bacillus tianshenii]|nr:hypothetical protein LC040_08235 [Bacillus tianshenii]